MILLGFTLTLATTGAGLIPPYLTAPLMGGLRQHYERYEEITEECRLSPAAREKALDYLQDQDGPGLGRMVSWCLLGMGGPAVAAWLFGWAQGIVMLRVASASREISRSTYAHLHQLSFEIFGGSRTGDLIARGPRIPTGFAIFWPITSSISPATS